MSNEEFDTRLELFYGGANTNTATVYARLKDQPTGQGLTLGGYIRGPHCLFSTMLPATIRLADGGPGDSLLSKCVVPDPCYWTEELPALYDVHVELKRGNEVLAVADRSLGMRQFGARGKFFYQNGKRWTIRAAQRTTAPENLLHWHDTPLSLCVAHPSDALCDEASRSGVMIIALVAGSAFSIEAELRRLARHAAVAIIAMSADAIEPAWQAAAPNTVLAVADVAAADGAQAIVRRADELLASEFTLPVIALSAHPDDGATPDELRAACDQLQARLAPSGDLAGYIV